MFPSPHVPEHLARLRDALDSSPEESVTFGPSVFLGQEVFEPSGTRRKLGYGGTGCHHCNVKGIAQHPKKYGAIDPIYIIHMLDTYDENKKR
jgi:hypothetical protein